jgi:hypothetical protein
MRKVNRTIRRDLLKRKDEGCFPHNLHKKTLYAGTKWRQGARGGFFPPFRLLSLGRFHHHSNRSNPGKGATKNRLGSVLAPTDHVGYNGRA